MIISKKTFLTLMDKNNDGDSLNEQEMYQIIKKHLISNEANKLLIYDKPDYDNTTKKTRLPCIVLTTINPEIVHINKANLQLIYNPNKTN